MVTTPYFAQTEDRELFERFHTLGDIEAKLKLLSLYITLVESIAQQYYRHGASRSGRDYVKKVALNGLEKAFIDYDEREMWRTNTIFFYDHASTWIRHEIESEIDTL